MTCANTSQPTYSKQLSLQILILYKPPAYRSNVSLPFTFLPLLKYCIIQAVISIIRQGNTRMLFSQSVTGLQRVLAYIVFDNTKCK